VMLTTCMLFTTFVTFFWKPAMSQDFKTRFFQADAQCDKELSAFFREKGPSSILTPNDYKRIAEIQKKYLIPLGPHALPYLIVLSQEGRWWLKIALPESWGGHSGAIPEISKFRPHEIKLSQIHPPKFTTEEFYEIVEVIPNEYKIYLSWLLEGERRTPKWFSERYTKWLAARKQGNAKEAQAMYQKLLNIGIAAIPLWLKKLQSEQDKNIRQQIINALSYLTNGEVKSNMSPQECLNWWERNKERWTVPFPKSKREFLEWLEKEGWEEERLAIPCVITISRLEDEGAIDALLRFLRHPSSSVRGKSLEQIMILFGEQLPKEYALGIGTDGWERIGDLMEMGKYDLVRKRLMEAKKKVRDEKVADNIARELSRWWQENRGRVKIYWQRAWEIYH